MNVPAFIFREYDIRGVADRDLVDETAYAIGRALGFMLKGRGGKAPRLALGRDCRLSSPRLYAATLEGLLRAGVHVLDVGIGPTPHLYFAVHHLDADGGIMITGSHNPAEDNGFKVMRGKASFFGSELQDLRARIEAENFNDGAADPPRGDVVETDVHTAYVDTLAKSVKVNPAIKFVVDAGNGVGGPMALASMRLLGLSPDPLFCEMDGHFPHHHPDPTVPKNLESLIARVKETGARVGIAYDGDADRLGAVDANGEIIWGDRLMILFSRGLLKEHPGAAILGEVKCSQTLYDDIRKHGGRPIMWKTGHSLIKTKMKEEQALLAGEMSGHLFFADRYFGYDDALYASLRLLEILSADPRSIGEMLSDVPKTYSTPEIRVDCPEAIKFDVVKHVTEHYVALGKKVVTIDGARISFDAAGAPPGAKDEGRDAGSEANSGVPGVPAWGLVRASNTGAVLVMRFEAGSEKERDAIRAEVENVVKRERERLAPGR